MTEPAELDTVTFATRFLELLHGARTSTTYKYAVLLALIEECQESVGLRGGPRGSTTTRQLAQRVLELYWRQAMPFVRDGEATLLRQITGGNGTLVTRVAEVRATRAGLSSNLHGFRLEHPGHHQDLLDEIEWTLIRYPLPLLQRVGGSEMAILYRIGWSEQPSRAPVSRYQRSLRRGSSSSGEFDNTIRFLPGVERHLSVLAGLFQPLIQREWTRFVAACNGSAVEDLEAFLFEPTRADLSECREGLLQLQQGQCFYCGSRVAGQADVDHFLPWSRCRHESVENLVVAHQRCNNDKRDHLAGPPHLGRWRRRLDEQQALLQQVADQAKRPYEPERSLALARSLYRGIGQAPLWLRGKDFEVVPVEESLRLIA